MGISDMQVWSITNYTQVVAFTHHYYYSFKYCKLLRVT
jgi:hypothetical protein